MKLNRCVYALSKKSGSCLHGYVSLAKSDNSAYNIAPSSYYLPINYFAKVIISKALPWV